ncbi:MULTISPECIES: hypothetical protein [Corynebacterium]|uniref:hypothetical protein n=1 Tax=Corynebacterium TaxID=1716 RepID=UPI00195D83F7|nr:MULTISPECIES: hypothetical protein [Corynebacterium]MDN8624088.1 hypothetical protein [Corynebacterium kroppenstedtii]QRQ64132.1 hypothetical protein I6J23_05595 [Corynebacterium kroppenstedtii]
MTMQYNDKVFAAVMFFAGVLLLVVRAQGYIDESWTNRLFAGIIIAASVFQFIRWSLNRRATRPDTTETPSQAQQGPRA